MKLSRKPKILAITYNVAHTGFTRVMHSILAHLPRADFDLHYLGIGGQEDWFGLGDAVTFYPHDPASESDNFRSELAMELMEKDPPDILFVMNDLWLFQPYDRALRQFRGQTQFVTYVPFDGHLRREKYLKHFSENNYFVAYTQFGKLETEKGVERLRQAGAINHFPGLRTIPHGVDRQRFYPLFSSPHDSQWREGRMTAKREVFGPELAGPDSFIVLNANRPSERKRLDLTIAGFAQFVQNKPAQVKLCLHHALLMPDEKVQIEAWIEHFGIEDHVIWNIVNFPDEHFSDAQLNQLYNACDVGLNTSEGEGWGLIAFEHAATGAAQVVPDHSACTELWEGAAELLPTTLKLEPVQHPMIFRETTADAVAAALERLYQDRNHLRTMSLQAYENACHPDYDWAKIGESWGSLFHSLIQSAQTVDKTLAE